MSCESLTNRLGYSCRETASGSILVTTPFEFTDGELISFYLNEDAGSVCIHDNGDTLSHLAAVGLDISTRKKWASIRNAISVFGLELQDSGRIIGKHPKQDEQLLISKYICALISIAEIERELLGLSEEQTEFVAEVEERLRKAYPASQIELGPTVPGHSGKLHKFHFSLDGKMVDALKPHGRNTGSELRKVLDVSNYGTKLNFMAVIDDRVDSERAKAETDILSTLVGVLQFTELERLVGTAHLRH